jgi:hypothetical protein
MPTESSGDANPYVSPLAHLTNALRVPFSVPAGSVGRFQLLKPQRIQMQVEMEFSSNLVPKDYPMPDVSLSGLDPDFWARAVPTIKGVEIGRVSNPSVQSALVIAPDSQALTGNLVWEPISSPAGTEIYPNWRLWVEVQGLAPIQFNPGRAPWNLPRSFVWPNANSLDATNGLLVLDLTPLDLATTQTASHIGTLPSPVFAGPGYSEWIQALSNSIDRVFDPTGFQVAGPAFQGANQTMASSNEFLSVVCVVPNAAFMSRWGLASDLFKLALTRDANAVVERFPWQQSARFRGGNLLFYPGNPSIPGLGSRSFESYYEWEKSKAQERLRLWVSRYSRPQSAYFPNDRVRIGLLTDEAEILAAIRSGSTNQVFGAVAQP